MHLCDDQHGPVGVRDGWYHPGTAAFLAEDCKMPFNMFTSIDAYLAYCDKLTIDLAAGHKANEKIPEVVSETHFAFEEEVVSSSYVEMFLIKDMHEGEGPRREAAHQQATQKSEQLIEAGKDGKKNNSRSSGCRTFSRLSPLTEMETANRRRLWTVLAARS